MPGERDGWLPFFYAEEDRLALELDEVEHMVRALPDVSSFVPIIGAGHSPTIEQPDATIAAVSTFLDGLSI